MKVEVGRVNHGDCLKGMAALAADSVDLVFADPPFNIGYDYDEYDDRKARHHYLQWSRDWMAAVWRVLKPDGTFWLAIGDEYAAELKLIAQGAFPGLPLVAEMQERGQGGQSSKRHHVETAKKGRRGRGAEGSRGRTKESAIHEPQSALTGAASGIGFHCRSWVIWYYTFGVHCTKKFTRSHAHLFHFVKDLKQFTFNVDAVKVPSARQLVYADRRANPSGRMPDDTWLMPAGTPTADGFVLRPQDVPEGFRPESDTWYFSRVAGTFKEREGWHGCQMPEQLLGRIIRASSNEGEVVMDPFAGSGTTLAVAKKLGRKYVGFEMSKQYFDQAERRLKAAKSGDSLDGAENPLTSAPPTVKQRGSRRTRSLSDESVLFATS